jgi:hypothetical protein
MLALARRGLRAGGVGAVVALGYVLPASPARADPDAPSASDAAGEHPKHAESPEYPHVRMTIDPSGGSHSWLLRIQNTDSIPLRLVGDARLLSLDVTPVRKAKGARPTTLHCTLPAEMRPASDEERLVVVQPKLTYIEEFDPTLYCFDSRSDRALTAGATVVGRFGFGPRRAKASPPYVLSPELARERSPMKEILGEEFTVPEPAAPNETAETAEASVDPPTREEASVSEPTLSTPARIDASSLRDLSLSVTVTNPTSRTMHLLLRAETLAIQVTGPLGATQTTRLCSRFVAPTPIPELFTTLPPHARTTTEILVTSLCPSSFFKHAGLYSLRAELDTHLASGERIGIHSFVGEVEAKSPTLLRLRVPPRVDEP